MGDINSNDHQRQDSGLRGSKGRAAIRSDSPFTIATPVVTVTAPNTLVSWPIGSSRAITWSHNLGIGEAVRIEASADGGATWSEIAANVANATTTSGTFAWTVAGPVTTAGRIRVGWATTLSVQDMSNVNFTVTSADRGDRAEYGRQRGPLAPPGPSPGPTTMAAARRSRSRSARTPVAPGSPWRLGAAAATATTGSWTGVLPAVVTSQHLIRVSPAGNPGDGDVSNVVFTLVAPTIAVTSPNTAVAWAIGSNQTVELDAQSRHGRVRSHRVERRRWCNLGAGDGECSEHGGHVGGRSPGRSAARPILRGVSGCCGCATTTCRTAATSTSR